jgi:hypothetical protein
MRASEENDRLLAAVLDSPQAGPSSRNSSRGPSRVPSRLSSKRPSFELEDGRRRKSEDVERFPGSGRSSRGSQRAKELDRVCGLYVLCYEEVFS